MSLREECAITHTSSKGSKIRIFTWVGSKYTWLANCGSSQTFFYKGVTGKAVRQYFKMLAKGCGRGKWLMGCFEYAVERDRRRMSKGAEREHGATFSTK